MREKAFTEFLRNRYPNPNSWKTFLSESKRIQLHAGNLDDLYENDGFAALLHSFQHSKKDGIKPTDDIPHNADPYVTANFRRLCIELYSEFYQSNPRR
jgi:hypothetical protein